MQNKEKNIKFEKISQERYFELMVELSSMFNCEKISLEASRLYTLSSEYSTYCYYEGDIDSLQIILEKIERALELHPYCVGIPILMERQNGELIPLIPLEKYLKTCKNKITIRGKLAEKFTYGKSIEADMKYAALNFDYLKRFSSQKLIYIVYNENGLFLGYARIEDVNKDRVKIIPVRDIGWYLRKGG